MSYLYTPELVLSKVLRHLPNAWFANGKQEGEDTYRLAHVLATMLAIAGQQTEELRRATKVLEATGADLIQHGIDYGVPMIEGEEEDDYRARIVASISARRNTAPSIEAAVTQASGFPCRVYEPFEEVFMVDDSLTDEHYVEGAYYSEGVFDVQVEGLFPYTRQVVELVRPAGYHAFYTSRFTDGLVTPAPTLGGATLIGGQNWPDANPEAITVGDGEVDLEPTAAASGVGAVNELLIVGGMYVGLASVIEVFDEEGNLLGHEEDYGSWPVFEFDNPGTPVDYSLWS